MGGADGLRRHQSRAVPDDALADRPPARLLSVPMLLLVSELVKCMTTAWEQVQPADRIALLRKVGLIGGSVRHAHPQRLCVNRISQCIGDTGGERSR